MSRGNDETYLKKMDAPFPLFRVDLSGSEEDLKTIGTESGTGLSPDELRTVRNHFEKKGRPPTNVELQSIGQAWSEHCCYKSSKTFLKEHILPIGDDKIIDRGDAGVMAFDDEHVYALRIESHNHPSAVEPYGGAATGIGGIIRDILCMGAQPVALVDPLFFGELDTPQDDLPEGVKHPRYLLDGVVSGIRDYGNRVGIPTVSGAVAFHPLYTGNCLVNVGCVGIAPKSRLYKNRVGGVGDKYVLVGGFTGRDGIHGVTFASAELDEKSEEESRGAVQLGDPITKEPLIHAVLDVAEKKLITGMKDLGGGGLSCVVGEMALSAGYGAKVELEKVHLKEEGMEPWEIWISESQERMMLSVPEENIREVLDVFDLYDLEARIIGEVIPEKNVKVSFHGVKILDLELDFLTAGPEYCRPYESKPRKPSIEKNVPEPEGSWNDLILDLLSDPEICNREWVIRQYDHEVRGNTVIKPLTGDISSPTHADASVIRPVEGSRKALAIGVGQNPHACLEHPYRGGKWVLCESIQSVFSVGARPDSFSNCLNFGNPEKPDRFGDFKDVVEGIGEVAGAFSLPSPSGNVSFYNETPSGSVPPTPVVMMVGMLEDYSKATTPDLKGEGNGLYVMGTADLSLGASAYLRHAQGEDAVPDSDPAQLDETGQALLREMAAGNVVSCHDVSAGGLIVALCEMAFGSPFGFSLESDRDDPAFFFSEGTGRFVVEVPKECEEEFVKETGAIKIAQITEEPVLVGTCQEELLFDLSLEEARERWNAAFKEVMEGTH